MFQCAVWAGTGDLNLIIGLCSPKRGSRKVSHVYIWLSRGWCLCFFVAPVGLAGNGSHEGSRGYVLQQGLGSIVAAGGGVVTVPVLSIRWFPLCQLACVSQRSRNISCSWNWDQKQFWE